MKSWSWWRVFLPCWVIVGHNVIYVLVGFLCLFAVRYGEDEEAEEPAKVQSDLVYQVASLVCVLISTGWYVLLANVESQHRHAAQLNTHAHPFVERLIGTIRREYLDQTLFWTT